MDCTLRDGRLVYTLPAEKSEMKRESGFTLYRSSVGERISRKKKENIFLLRFLSTSPAIAHGLNLMQSRDQGKGK